MNDQQCRSTNVNVHDSKILGDSNKVQNTIIYNSRFEGSRPCVYYIHVYERNIHNSGC